jgi:hypothetical protein
MEDTIMACNHERSLSCENRGRTLAVILSCLIAGSASLALGADISATVDADSSVRISQSGDRMSNQGRAEAETRTNAQAEVQSGGFESNAQAESGASVQGSARASQNSDDEPSEPVGDRVEGRVETLSGRSQQIAGRAQAAAGSSAEAAIETGQNVAAAASAQLEVTADRTVEVTDRAASGVAGTVHAIEAPETDADLAAMATGDAAATGEVRATDAVDATVKSTLKGEVAGSINSTVQDDIRDSIQADLVEDITRSLPLPGRN